MQERTVKGGQKKCDVFFGCLFRQTSNVYILETVYLNDLKFNLQRALLASVGLGLPVEVKHIVGKSLNELSKCAIT